MLDDTNDPLAIAAQRSAALQAVPPLPAPPPCAAPPSPTPSAIDNEAFKAEVERMVATENTQYMHANAAFKAEVEKIVRASAPSGGEEDEEELLLRQLKAVRARKAAMSSTLGQGQ